jgi:hypothetical protein
VVTEAVQREEEKYGFLLLAHAGGSRRTAALSDAGIDKNLAKRRGGFATDFATQWVATHGRRKSLVLVLPVPICEADG